MTKRDHQRGYVLFFFALMFAGVFLLLPRYSFAAVECGWVNVVFNKVTGDVYFKATMRSDEPGVALDVFSGFGPSGSGGTVGKSITINVSGTAAPGTYMAWYEGWQGADSACTDTYLYTIDGPLPSPSPSEPPPPPSTPSPSPSPSPPADQAPVGAINGVSGPYPNEALFGWSVDQDTPSQNTAVHIYIDGPAGSGAPGDAVLANSPRPDVNAWCISVGIPCPGDHGFVWSIPSQYKDGVTHTLYVYGINTNPSGVNPLLGTTTFNISNQAPTASNVKAQEPDYCLVGPSVTVSWNYSDPELTPQSAYQVQVDNSGGFNSPEFDSGKSAGAISSYYVGSGLTWNTVYRSRVRVWDGGDTVSAWTEQSLCAGPPGNPSGCTGNQQSWKAPNNQYPSQINTFSWTPSKIAAGKVTQFDDAQTTCYKTPPNTVDNCLSWNWTFGDGGTSTLRDPTHTFASYGTFNVTLKATDSLNGYACSATKTVSVQRPIPIWKEIIPE